MGIELVIEYDDYVVGIIRASSLSLDLGLNLGCGHILRYSRYFLQVR